MHKADNKRMILNTVFMYFRMILLILIKLYTVPVVLRTLGVEDYGLYQVVGGFVIMFGFFNGAFISGCQRFLSYAIGKNDPSKLENTFNVTITIFSILSFVCLFALEFMGVWFLNNQMTIPQDRIEAANWVFQFSVVSFVINILVIPFNSIIVSHEKLSVYAYVSVTEAVLQLLIVILLPSFCGDLLIIYSGLILIIALVIAIFYWCYCRSCFIETRRIKFSWDSKLIKDIGSYAGWNVVGSIALSMRNYGLNILMNLFFGPILNAAHAIASQINGITNQLLNNVYMATRPNMVKLYASGNKKEMWDVVFRSTKYSFFLLMLVAVPFLIETEAILTFWLKVVPDYSVIMVRLFIISTIVESLSNQIIGAFQAENQIKYYQSISSVLLLLVLPISYCALLIYKQPVLPYVFSAIISVIYTISIIIIAINKISLSFKFYCTDVLIRTIPTFLLAYVSCIFLFRHSYEGIIQVFTIIVASMLISSIFILTTGLDSIERNKIFKLIKNKFK